MMVTFELADKCNGLAASRRRKKRGDGAMRWCDFGEDEAWGSWRRVVMKAMVFEGGGGFEGCRQGRWSVGESSAEEKWSSVCWLVSGMVATRCDDEDGEQ